MVGIDFEVYDMVGFVVKCVEYDDWWVIFVVQVLVGGKFVFVWYYYVEQYQCYGVVCQDDIYFLCVGGFFDVIVVYVEVVGKQVVDGVVVIDYEQGWGVCGWGGCSLVECIGSWMDYLFILLYVCVCDVLGLCCVVMY